MLDRHLQAHVATVIEEYRKMAFVSGPRQVGKTTLARRTLSGFGQGTYFNWDFIPDQKRLLKDPYFFEKENRDPTKPFLVVLDEIHKYARWKNLLKGAYDRYREEFRFLVTGSGRLDLFRAGGDSLMGRYLPLPLFPLSVGELTGKPVGWREFLARLDDPPPPDSSAQTCWETLFRFSGFPEPFLKASASFHQMWFQQRKGLLLRDDIRGATQIREISLLEMLSHLIPERVGSPLSINSLREDLGVAFETVRDWVEVLARFYYLFRVPPFGGSLARTLKKETKTYLYDWSEVEDEGRRFENMVALHLHRAVQTWRATGQGDPGLGYVRDKEKREVDFVLTDRSRPVCLVECKFRDETLSPHLAYFQERLGVPHAVQLVHPAGVMKRVRDSGRTRWVVSASRWLRGVG